MEDDALASASEPIGAPTDPLRPTGRVAEEALDRSKAGLAARSRKMLRVLGLLLAAAVLLALLFFVVSALGPKPDL